MDVLCTRNIVGIQQIWKKADPFYQEVNDFISCERILESLDNTCYLQSALITLNSTKRIVMNMLMRDPFPFERGTFSREIRNLMIEYRKLDE